MAKQKITHRDQALFIRCFLSIVAFLTCAMGYKRHHDEMYSSTEGAVAIVFNLFIVILHFRTLGCARLKRFFQNACCCFIFCFQPVCEFGDKKKKKESNNDRKPGYLGVFSCYCGQCILKSGGCKFSICGFYPFQLLRCILGCITCEPCRVNGGCGCLGCYGPEGSCCDVDIEAGRCCDVSGFQCCQVNGPEVNGQCIQCDGCINCDGCIQCGGPNGECIDCSQA